MAQLLSAVTPGTLVKLNESGSPVEFYVAAQNYESGLNGAGRTLLVRKDVYQNGQWNASNVNTYANSTIDTWFNGTYKTLLDPWVQTAIGTTTFYYTPGNGDNTVTTLARSVFALSLTEFGESHPYANVEGSSLSISSTLKPTYVYNQWTRSLYTDEASMAWFLTTNGGLGNNYCTTSYGYRPCFTLPSTLYVWDDGTVSQTPPPPASITTPAFIMQGNEVLVSWTAIDGADSYTLQRKADSGEWEQVYSGADTSFTDTAGEWKTVQYQVQAVFDGVPGAWSQSDVVEVVSKSAVAISGSDGDLGTITSDIGYSVSTDTGKKISLTRTVNGVLVARLEVDSGLAYSIPVLDLPTGTGTIVITATVQTDSGPVTVTRTWTYTKQAQTFPGAGGVAQLTQDGQEIFPLTLAEAVKPTGGPWGGNLSTALDKLALAAVFNRQTLPKYTEVNVDLSTAQAGDIVNLPENEVMVQFYVASLDYEPALNTGGTRVLLVRKDVYQNGQWNSTNVNTYANSTIDTWFNSTYKPMLDSKVLAEIGETTFYYTPGNGSNEVTTLARAVFALSLTELGKANTGANVEGLALSIASLLQIAYLNGYPNTQWTRTPSTGLTDSSFFFGENGVFSSWVCTQNTGYRPCFTLPATFQATYYVDTNGGVHEEQEYTTAGDFADLFGNIIPTVKIETGSYVGTGTYGADNPNTLTFSGKPLVVFIFKENEPNEQYMWSLFTLWDRGQYQRIPGPSQQSSVYSSFAYLYLNSLDSSIYFYATGSEVQQANISGASYSYIAFLQ